MKLLKYEFSYSQVLIYQSVVNSMRRSYVDTRSHLTLIWSGEEQKGWIILMIRQ